MTKREKQIIAEYEKRFGPRAAPGIIFPISIETYIGLLERALKSGVPATIQDVRDAIGEYPDDVLI